MTDDQQRVAEQDFNRLWEALLEPMRALERQVADLSRQSARAEVAGAVEVVSALGSAGKKGRLVYLTTDDQIYYDDGTAWTALGGAKIATHSVELSSGTSTSSTSFVDVTGSDISHTFTRDNALVAALVMATGNTGTTAEVVPQVDGADGTTVSGVKFAVAQSALIASVFSNLLSASSPATIRLRLRSSSGSSVSVNIAVLLMYVIVEF